jgi:hypothetical protein
MLYETGNAQTGPIPGPIRELRISAPTVSMTKCPSLQANWLYLTVPPSPQPCMSPVVTVMKDCCDSPCGYTEIKHYKLAQAKGHNAQHEAQQVL